MKRRKTRITLKPELFLIEHTPKNSPTVYKLVTRKGKVFGTYPTAEIAREAAITEARKFLVYPPGYLESHRLRLELLMRNETEKKDKK